MIETTLERIRSATLVTHSGRVTKVMPTFLEADGPCAPVGSLCTIEPGSRMASIKRAALLAEVIGIGEGAVRLAPLQAMAAVLPGDEVIAHVEQDLLPVGDGFLGRAVDPLGRALDGGGPILADTFVEPNGRATLPMERTTPAEILETGVRAIDGLLPIGRGQRMGIFAAAGVGKTTLLGQFAHQTAAQRMVLCLVGERGREVEALWSGLSAAARARTTLVAATSDQPAAVRARAGAFALALAEYWRDQGQSVLLLLDSVTRLAMALRELGLAAGEPPTVRAYPPSVFSAIPRLIERCGAVRSGGAITALFTVLSETDDLDDPICEMMKSLLDGHIILSRSLAERGRFPAIDVPRSISRLAPQLQSASHRNLAQKAVTALTLCEEARTLIDTGLYQRGGNPELDRALDLRAALADFLQQAADEAVPADKSLEALAAIIGGGR